MFKYGAMLKMVKSTREITGDKIREADELYDELIEYPPSSKEFQKLAEAVIEANPKHLDAATAYALNASFTQKQKIKILVCLLKYSEQDIADIQEKYPGVGLWSLFDARPYLRTKESLALLYFQNGQYEKATQVWRWILDVNPSDNQGVRYLIPSGCIAAGKLKLAKIFLSKEGDEVDSPAFAYARMLLLLLDGKFDAASRLFEIAHGGNHYLRSLLIKQVEYYPEIESYSLGSPGEAVVLAPILRPVWLKYPFALQWLSDRSDDYEWDISQYELVSNAFNNGKHEYPLN